MNGVLRSSFAAKRPSDVFAWVAHSTFQELIRLTSTQSKELASICRWTRVNTATELAALEANPLPLVLEPELVLADADEVENTVRLVRAILIDRRAQPIILLGRVTAKSIRSLQRFLSIPGVLTFFLGADTCEELLAMLRTAQSRPNDMEERQLLQRCLRLPRPIRDVVLLALETPHDWTVKRLAAEAHVSRRTLERAFRRAALQPPAALLALLSGDDGTRELPTHHERNRVA